MIKKLTALVTFKDGDRHIAEYSLRYNLSFTVKEMKKRLMERTKKPIKEIQILKKEK